MLFLTACLLCTPDNQVDLQHVRYCSAPCTYPYLLLPNGMLSCGIGHITMTMKGMIIFMTSECGVSSPASPSAYAGAAPSWAESLEAAQHAWASSPAQRALWHLQGDSYLTMLEALRVL